jgi:hypothetical protein
MNRRAQYLDGWDISVVVAYFILVLATGFYVSNYQSLNFLGLKSYVLDFEASNIKYLTVFLSLKL